ncbi:MFS transporter [Streptomyces sp. NPDC005438]|uniref:MFS transporter n=1 Tax=Streptomyces sp. NPDC005438 TaxID=3156880 RepID=UPI0033B1E324
MTAPTNPPTHTRSDPAPDPTPVRPGPEARTPTSLRRPWLALAVLCAGNLMIILDGSIVTVALPAIQRDLGFGPSGLAWVVNSYLIAFGGLLLLSGRLGDLLGGRRVFVAGLVVFTLASLACGLAWTPAALVAFRFLQGVGGALASAVALGMIVTLFQGAAARARALAAYAFVAAAGSSLGLILGGVLTQGLGWRWVFLVNVPIGVLTLVLTVRAVPVVTGLGLRAGADLVGATLVTGGLMLLVYAILRAEGHYGTRTWVLLLGSLALLAAFVVRQRSAARPLLPLRVLRSRNVSGANAVMVLLVAGLFGFQFCTALYLQNVLGYGALGTGLAFLPAPVTIAVVSLGLSARLNRRYGARTVLLVGLALVAGALALLARVPGDGRYVVDLAPAFVLLGLGFGAAMPALMGRAMSVASAASETSATTADHAGVASGLVNTTQQVGAALGTAVLATVAASRTATLLAEHHSRADALTGGFRLAYLCSAAFVTVGLALATLLPREPAPARSGTPSAGAAPARR